MIIDNNNLSHVVYWSELIRYVYQCSGEDIRCNIRVLKDSCHVRLTNAEAMSISVVFPSTDTDSYDGVVWKAKLDRAFKVLR